LKLLWACAGACTLALAACADAPQAPVHAAAATPAPGKGLVGTRWIGIVDDGIDPQARPRLEFVGAGRVSGYTGCNVFSGAWKMQGEEVRMAGLAMTKRMCVGAAGETEKRFLAAIASGAHGRREGGRLVFTGPKGERFEFEPAAAA
jgi:heat shock protein HslJ